MLRLWALSICALASAAIDSTPARAAPASAASERLNRITIRTVGEGSPVVLIPGLASSSAVYDGVAAKIGSGHKLILVQVNGFAGSQAGSGPVDGLIDGSVDELAGWLAQHKVEKPAVIGHSMGGLMAMMLAGKHPAAAGKLLIVDALPFYGMLMGPTATPDLIRPVVEQMRAGLVNGTMPPQVPPHMSNSESGKARILEWMKASDPKIVGEALVEDATTDFRPQLPRLASVPVTVLYAAPTAEFKPIADALYRDAYKSLPKARLVAVEGSEHFIMLDQPARFAEEVEAFLR